MDDLPLRALHRPHHRHRFLRLRHHPRVFRHLHLSRRSISPLRRLRPLSQQLRSILLRCRIPTFWCADVREIGVPLGDDLVGVAHAGHGALSVRVLCIWEKVERQESVRVLLEVIDGLRLIWCNISIDSSLKKGGLPIQRHTT